MWCVSGRSAGFPLGSQLCWAPILGELSFASLWALLTSINGRSASWASLAGKAQLRQDKKGALLTSINRRSASWASLEGRLSCAKKKADLHDGGSASWAPFEGKPQLVLLLAIFRIVYRSKLPRDHLIVYRKGGTCTLQSPGEVPCPSRCSWGGRRALNALVGGVGTPAQAPFVSPLLVGASRDRKSRGGGRP